MIQNSLCGRHYIIKVPCRVYSTKAEETLEGVICSLLQIHGRRCGVFGRSRHRRKCGSHQHQCSGDGRHWRQRFPIARPRSRGSPALHCDAGPKQRNTAGDQELQNRTTCRSSGVSAGLFWYPWDELIRIERVGSLALSGRTYNRCKATRLTHSGPSGAPARLSPSIRSVAYR